MRQKTVRKLRQMFLERLPNSTNRQWRLFKRLYNRLNWVAKTKFLKGELK